MNDVCIVDTLYSNRDPRIYNDYSPTLRSERFGLLVAYGCAMRGRYDDTGIINQQLECNGTEYCNALTTVLQKDCLVLEVRNE